MNPNAISPQSPNLVTAVMDDRMREAAQMRLANNVSPAGEMDTPHRFKRFLVAATHSPRHAKPAVEAR